MRVGEKSGRGVWRGKSGVDYVWFVGYRKNFSCYFKNRKLVKDFKYGYDIIRNMFEKNILVFIGNLENRFKGWVNVWKIGSVCSSVKYNWVFEIYLWNFDF